MKTKDNKQQKAIAKYLRLKEEFLTSESELADTFKGYKPLLKRGCFSEAKEYCRDWPDSPSKILAFREILFMEDKYKENNHVVRTFRSTSQ